jgi:asparagine synthase (glutamine-hydrolysing)
MSGICGYLGGYLGGQHGVGAGGDAVRRQDRNADDDDDDDDDGGDDYAGALLARMGARMAEFDAAPVRTVQSGGCGVAVAAAPDSVSMHKKDGLVAAVWGRPLLDGSAERVAQRLAESWSARGPQACCALSGAFAACVVDALSGDVLLVVDRNATYPMMYQSVPHGLLFGSSPAALQLHPLARGEIDPQALYNYLYFHMVPAPRSVYCNQFRLLPGEYLHYRRGRMERGSYWKLRFDEERVRSFDQLKEQFLSTLEASVRSAAGAGAASDGVKVGAFLSGGTDSSTLAGMLAKVQGGAPSTYSIGFDVPGYDEMEYARVAAKHFGTNHHELYVTADDVVAAIPRIAAISDQPFGNASAVPAYYCAKMAREDGVGRLLGGDGGDELFGGNERYARQAVFERYEQLPSSLRQVVLEPLLFGVAGRIDLLPLRKARSYVEQAMVPMPARLETYNLLQRYGADKVLHADFLARIDTGAPQAQLSACYWDTEGLSQINRMQALDLRYTLADNDLPKVRKACELAGLEVAFPFLSDEMLAFSAQLSPEDKLKGTRLRYFFKRALRGHLPSSILRKKKHGFGLPFGHWLQSHAQLRALAFDSLSDLKLRRIVRPEFIDTLMHQLVQEHPAYHGTMVWVLMMLEQWLRQRASRAGQPTSAELSAGLAGPADHGGSADLSRREPAEAARGA